MRERLVTILAFGGAQLLDVAGPAEVFGVADALVGGGAYRVVVATADGRDVRASCGPRIAADAALLDLAGPIDTLVVPGGPTWPGAASDAALLDALRAAAGRSDRVAGVCAGALLLAAAGLLDGRRATTHWRFLDDLAEGFPAVAVERGPIFVEDAGVMTCAGASAGIDLALAVVEDDLGPAVAHGVARHLVVFIQRAGDQPQLSVRLETRPPRRSGLRPLLDAIAADPAGDHRLAALGRRAGFSERHLARLFLRETGTTPGRWVERVRLEAARAALEGSDAPLDEVARSSGLRSAERLRRLFIREMGVTPGVFRSRTRSRAAAERAAGDPSGRA